nr:3-phytase b [Quercus suber]
MAWWTTFLAFVGLLSALYIWPQTVPGLRWWSHSISTTESVTPVPQENQWDVLRHQGGNSPWIPKLTGLAEKTTSDVPHGCRIDQVHMMQGMLDLYGRIQRSNITLQGDLAFVNDSRFFLDDPTGHFEQLVSTGPYAGTLEAFTTGVELRSAYKALLDHAITQHRISLWASDSKRVIDTAKYFSAGFFGIDWRDLANLIVIPETRDRAGDTLTPGRTCLRYADNIDEHGHDYGTRKLFEWRSIYLPPIIERLAQQNPDFKFTETEVYSMQELCGFETIALGSSPWCAVFTQQEWEAFEYARDLLHFYKSGPGNPYGPTMGFLWLNATAQLLQQGSSLGTLFFSLFVVSPHFRALSSCPIRLTPFPAYTTATSSPLSPPLTSSRKPIPPCCRPRTSLLPRIVPGALPTLSPWAAACSSNGSPALLPRNAGTTGRSTRTTYTARLHARMCSCASTSTMGSWRCRAVRMVPARAVRSTSSCGWCKEEGRSCRGFASYAGWRRGRRRTSRSCISERGEGRCYGRKILGLGRLTGSLLSEQGGGIWFTIRWTSSPDTRWTRNGRFELALPAGTNWILLNSFRVSIIIARGTIKPSIAEKRAAKPLHRLEKTPDASCPNAPGKSKRAARKSRADLSY